MDVGDLVGAGLASRERLVALALGVAPIAGPDEALPAHEAAHGGVAGYQAEGGVLAREGDEVVVRGQLPGPSRMIAVLAGDAASGERGTDARMGAGVCMHLAGEGGEGVLCAARDVPPALDRLEREADGLAGGGVPPGAGGERLDAGLELAVVGGGGHQGAEDLKAQTCPSHTRRSARECRWPWPSVRGRR